MPVSQASSKHKSQIFQKQATCLISVGRLTACGVPGAREMSLNTHQFGQAAESIPLCSHMILGRVWTCQKTPWV